jgi:hypothetical protein
VEAAVGQLRPVTTGAGAAACGGGGGVAVAYGGGAAAAGPRQRRPMVYGGGGGRRNPIASVVASGDVGAKRADNILIFFLFLSLARVAF